MVRAEVRGGQGNLASEDSIAKLGSPWRLSVLPRMVANQIVEIARNRQLASVYLLKAACILGKPAVWSARPCQRGDGIRAGCH